MSRKPQALRHHTNGLYDASLSRPMRDGAFDSPTHDIVYCYFSNLQLLMILLK